jgi:hypothetical protein
MEINSKIGITSPEYVHITISQIQILNYVLHVHAKGRFHSNHCCPSTTTLESSTTRVSGVAAAAS